MAISEFEIIRRNFAGRGVDRGDVVLGIGDDGAVVHMPSNCDLVTVVDTLVAGVHFPHETQAGTAPMAATSLRFTAKAL